MNVIASRTSLSCRRRSSGSELYLMQLMAWTWTQSRTRSGVREEAAWTITPGGRCIRLKKSEVRGPEMRRVVVVFFAGGSRGAILEVSGVVSSRFSLGLDVCMSEVATPKYHRRNVVCMPPVVPNTYHLRHVGDVPQVVLEKY